MSGGALELQLTQIKFLQPTWSFECFTDKKFIHKLTSLFLEASLWKFQVHDKTQSSKTGKYAK